MRTVMALRQWQEASAFSRLLFARKANPSASRWVSSTSKPPDGDLEAMLSTPSWSVKSLFQSGTASQSPPVTQKQLHHLLRLSALPIPTSAAQEEKLITDLQSQLKFVQAIQSVDTSGVEPLQSIRDETKEAEQEQEIMVATMQEEFDKEEVVGRRGRIRRREDAPNPVKESMEGWDPLAQAPKKMGRFFVVDTAKD